MRIVSGVPHVTVDEYIREQQEKKRKQKKQTNINDKKFAEILQKEMKKNG